VRDIARSLTGAALVLTFTVGTTVAQEPYRSPPQEVVDIVDAPPTPDIAISPDGAFMTVTRQRAYPSIAQLAQPAFGLAGIRFNPRTNGDDQPPMGIAIDLIRIADGQRWTIELPDDVQLSDPFWSPDGQKLAFTNTTDAGVQLWVVSVESKRARRLTDPELMAALGRPCQWMPDSDALLCTLIPADRGTAPERPRVPVGPTVQEATGGQRATVRTYQNLLENPFDKVLLDFYFTAQLARIGLDGERELLGEPAIFAQADPAPDGGHFLISRITRPYSYQVPIYGFPREIEVWGHGGQEVHKVASLPLAENVPIGGVREGPRDIGWTVGDTHTLVWVEALDGGDPKAEVEHRDRIVISNPPFDGDPLEVARTELRVRGFGWGSSSMNWSANGSTALVSTVDRPTRQAKTLLIDFAPPFSEPRLIWDLSTEDAYGDPGRPARTSNARGQSVMVQAPDRRSIYLIGDGASPDGDHPFIDRYNLTTGQTTRLWQSEDPYYERPVDMLDAEGLRLITRRESKTEPPNYFVRDLRTSQLRPLTDLKDPAPQLTKVSKQLIHYQRSDGVDLTGILYLPPNYRAGDRLPTVVWAYPREYKSADAAGQVRGSQYRFTFYRGYSHLLFLTQGYAVLDQASMPIVGEGDEEPNDSFVKQLVMNAQAAVDKLVDLGVTDADRIGVGGHSYGAFMTANLLAHSDIFRAGIARSGAYNRTLTPFGFQNERRTFWEAPEVYFAMSPFMHADSINEPILLLHGQADTNSGTFPIQSERLYHAIKGLGGTIKLVTYPYEQHGYRSRETTLDALYRQFEWFDRWVKNAPPREDMATDATGTGIR
jgi:dipeptidyl aminopeptidase/acylaminoacyl peptidase